MSTEDQARTLMNRHQHQVKNRQDTILARSAEEVGADPTHIVHAEEVSADTTPAVRDRK